ncbi:MAG: lipoate--protein ligase family protein [Acidimicrobiia bacterium]
MIHAIDASHPDEPALDTGISHAIVRAVGDSRLGETFRLHRATRIVAFGRQDRLAPEYAEAVRAAHDAGYLAVERLAGGRAAVFHEDTLAFSWAVPVSQPREGITERFETISRILVDSFRDLGADARVGELPGEYCPGAYSVNVGGVAKVMGVGQRLVRGAAHVGGVIVVDGGRRIADVLIPVYQALELEWDPRTSGDLADHVPTVTISDVADAVMSRLALHDTVVPTSLPDWIVAEGRDLAPGHIAPAA